MMAAPLGNNESQRLQALLDLAILDSEGEPEYDEIVELASEICQTPIALVSLLDSERQWFKAKKGLEAQETPRSISFCGHAIREQGVFVIEDAQHDQRFHDNPLVLGDPLVRFYAGAPLRTGDDLALGTLCVIDHAPRQLNDFQLRTLQVLAKQIVNLLELRKANLKLKGSMEEIVAQARLIADQQDQLVMSAEMAALGKMAAGIAHEINNPLAVIQGRSFQLRRSIQSGLIESEKMIKGFEYIENMCVRISKIIRGLRAFARDAGHDPMQEESLQRIIEETMDLCSERFRISGIALRLSIEPGLTLECRRTQISQVLLNLLNNSHDAVEHLSERWVEIATSQSDHNITLRITDSGSGIPRELINRIMLPFFTTKEIGRGTGLGLSIAKGIIDSHGGTLRYETINSHTSFVIELPIRQALPLLPPQSDDLSAG